MPVLVLDQREYFAVRTEHPDRPGLPLGARGRP